jgi:Skp family chaperone for outer membrane proteins
MKSIVSAAVAAVLMIGFAAEGYAAGTRDPGVNARQANQRDRVQQGARSGELTRRETRKAVEDQRDIRQLERAYKSDGTLTGRERADLHHEQNQASRSLYRNKHNTQDRPAAVPPATRDPGVNRRQWNQTGRVMQGVRTGELTRDEATELRAENKDIRQLEQSYKSDGALTKGERKDLHQQLNQQSKEIHEEKHDDESRPN